MSDETRFFSEEMSLRDYGCLAVRCIVFCALAYVVAWSPAWILAVLP